MAPVTYRLVMAESEPDPGADTEMFRAFVEREETYEARASHKGPVVVAAVAVLLAVIAFIVIVALG